MKTIKLISLIPLLLLLLSTITCQLISQTWTVDQWTAGTVNAVVVQPAVAAGGCPDDGSPSAEQSVGDETTYVGLNANLQYAGQRGWSDASARTICKLAFRLTWVEGDITDQTYYASIWSLDGTSLDTELATSTGVTGSNSWDSTWVVFEFSTPYETTGSTSYALVVYQGSVGVDYVLIDRADSDQGLAGQFEVWNDSGVIQLGVGWETAIRIYWQ